MNLIARLKALVNHLLQRASFARSVGVLVGRTATAQAIRVSVLSFIKCPHIFKYRSNLGFSNLILGIVAK